jgi:hypothetical protein
LWCQIAVKIEFGVFNLRKMIQRLADDTRQDGGHGCEIESSATTLLCQTEMSVTVIRVALITGVIVIGLSGELPA